MSTHTEDVAPLAPILTTLIENSGIELGTMDLLQAGFSEMIGQYGVQLKDIRVARTLLNADDVERAKKKGEVVEPNYRYDAAFPDPHPDSHAELITLRDFLARDWQPSAYTQYADEERPELDQFNRPVGRTTVTHDTESVFQNLDPKPLSNSAKRVLAKKQEEERERLAARARAERTQ